jgi:nitroimidazol reductase NimA-like FMN-containing flavoprotein (pyridoxamine 5'-phosphate oxidase superfamily)
MEVDRNGLEVLDREECLRLLADGTIGRLGLTSGALPTVLPVSYRLVDDRIVLRTNVGSKLEAATSGTVVAFEVDDVDPVWHTGWSVVVTGVARQVVDPDALARIAEAKVPRWAPMGADRYVEISLELVTGRRIPTWAKPEPVAT